METAVIVAIITGLCSVVGQYLIARQNKHKSDTEQAVKDALMQERLDGIVKRLDEHNNYASRFEEISVAIAEIKTELNTRRPAA